MTTLPDVTLVCLDCEDVVRAIKIMEYCKTQCEFGDVVFLTSEETDYPHTSIDKIGTTGNRVTGLTEYSKFFLHHLHEHVHTSHMLVVQHDGWILDGDKWNPRWMNLDYVGPLFVQYAAVGSGGFSLRSTRLMKLVSDICPPFENGTFGKTGFVWEDGMICFGLRRQLMAAGMRYAEIRAAGKFAYGGNKSCYCAEPFGFHGFYALDTLLGGTGENIPRTPQLEMI